MRLIPWLTLLCFLIHSPHGLAHEVPPQEQQPKLDSIKNSPKRSRGACGLGTSDGRRYNETNGLALKLGPPGAQNGHSNPLGLPPGPTDIEITYLHRCGFEGSAGLVPGLTGGVRYRAGRLFYGSFGGALLLTANGIGPGAYSAIGATIMRDWPVSFEVELKQGIGIGFGGGDTHLMFPYAFRIGAGVYW